MTSLSHSAANKFKTCPAQYKLHYIDRIRSHKVGSALLFGGALDEALNVLLETKLDEPTERATDDLDRIKQGFEYHLTYQMINKEMEDVRTSHFIEYFRSDFDPDVLTSAELGSLSMFIRNAGYIKDADDENSGQPNPIELYNEISVNIKEGQEIDGTDQSYYNYASWLSLKRKGHLMIDHYAEEIMPLIKRVVSVQKKVVLPNEDGDELIGYIDFEAELEGFEGVITVDNKTSTPKYKTTDINDKGQLVIYDEYTENGKGAYIVLLKKVKYVVNLKCNVCGEESTRRLKNCPVKKCSGKMEQVSKVPKIESQVLVDDINEEAKDLVFNELGSVLEDIKEGNFPQNRDSCFQFGRKCIYFDLCRSNPAEPDYTGLNKC